MTFAATVLTLYPEMFPGPLGIASPGGRWPRASGASTRATSATSRPTSTAPSTTRPAGGGAGMVLRADVLAAAIDSVAGAGRGRCSR